ncbi:hypothetical protein SCARD494_11156 [Seiridium cardinale]
MIPERNYLRAIVAHILQDPKFGAIYPSQSFYNFLMNDLLYQSQLNPWRSTEIIRHLADISWNTGSGFILRRQALIDIGGFPTHSRTEDVLSSMMMMMAKGWKTAYLAESLQYGLMPDSYLAHIKQFTRWASFLALAILQSALIGIWSRGHGTRTQLTMPASIIALVATLSLAVLSDFEHNRVLRPSLVAQSYLFFTALLDLARVRSQWLVDDNNIVASIVTATFVLKLAILAVESIEKHPYTSAKGDDVPPLERCGIFGHALLLWLNPLFMLGYRQDLAIDNLFPLDHDLRGSHLEKRLERRWKRTKKSRKHCLTVAVLVNFIPEIVISWFPRALNIAFLIAQPYLVKTTLGYIMDHDTLPASYGYGLIGAFGIVYIGAAISNQMFSFLCFRLMVKMRGSLVGMIYRDMLTIRAESKNSSSAMTLMSTDVDRICMTARWVVDMIPNIVQLGIAMWILSLELGAVCVAPVIVALLCGGGAAGIAKLVPRRQRKWIAAIQKRVGITSDILGVMKGVKMLGISEPLSKQIQGLRDFEIAESKRFRKVQVFLISMNIIPMISMSAVTFTVFAIVAKVSGSGTLGISQAFTSLSLLGILITPVGLLVSCFNNIVQAVSCLDRIQDFLLIEKRIDYRTRMPSSRTSSHEEKGSSRSGDKPADALIAVKEGTFGWDKAQDKPILKDISLEVRSSTLNLVVGPVASGKSTLLKSFLGETYLYSGSVHVAGMGDVAYCDQEAWILNQSIRDNIVAFSDYSEDFYNAVIRACQLEEDLSHLPKGDLSNVGSHGISLSGGQKQRLALARAVYSRQNIVIMDDTMKGLDADTSSKCFRALLGKNGLLRKSGITVIMATHNAQWFPFADQLIVLNGEGHIESCGSFEDLKDSDDYIKSLESSYNQDDDSEDDTESSETASKKLPVTPPNEAIQPNRGEKEAVTEPNRVKGRGNLNSSLPYYIKSLMSISFFIFCLLMGFQTACRIIQPLWLSFWTSSNARNSNEDPGKWIGIYVLFSVLNLGGMIVQFSLFLIRIIPRSAKELHWSVLEVAMRAPMSYFVATDVGQLVNRFSQDMTLVDFPLPISLMQTSEMMIAGIGEIILTCVSSGYLAIVIPVLGIVLFYIQRFYLRTSRQLRLLDLESKSPLYSFFISSFAGLTTIRAFSWSDKSYREHIQHLDTSQRPFYLLYCIQRWLMMVLELAVAGLCILLVGISVGIKDRVDPGLLGVALTNVTSFGQTMTQVIMFWTELETSLGAITRIREFIADTPKEREGLDEPPATWPSRGAISISGLSVKFGDHTVLDDINLEIGAGTRVAVCGRTGSGKSTLLALLLRLYEPSAGTISIDGVDSSNIKINALRESLVTLPQDPLLLAGTVRYNLDPSSGANDDQILTALEKTGLRMVIEEKGGLDADFNADWLSAGQRQLFCLARAMLRRSRILLLDEATSSLDHQTDEFIQSLIRREFTGWTMIVIAHRLKTVADFDKIVVLQDGRLAEVDSPTALLKKGGLFKSLWDLQES